ADRNRSHWSTSKTPSYTKSVSWQHHPNMRPCGINPTIIYRPYSFMAKISDVERGHFLTVIPHFAWRLVNPATLKYFDAPHRPMYMQEYLYSIRNHRYTATMLQHIAEDRDGTNH
ncbi:hypothetical protein P1S76_14095, partial [Escherichia coli]|nr:hypothetical protein [Escherichia coli]